MSNRDSLDSWEGTQSHLNPSKPVDDVGKLPKDGASSASLLPVEENDGNCKPSADSDASQQHQRQSRRTIILSSTDRKPEDVLCGRGKPFTNYPGNRRMHKIVNKYRRQYKEARRHDKGNFVVRIIREIQDSGGRFLTTYTGEGGGRTGTGHVGNWIEADYDVVYEKVSHVLRQNPDTAKKTPRLINRSVPGDDDNRGNPEERVDAARVDTSSGQRKKVPSSTADMIPASEHPVATPSTSQPAIPQDFSGAIAAMRFIGTPNLLNPAAFSRRYVAAPNADPSAVLRTLSARSYQQECLLRGSVQQANASATTLALEGDLRQLVASLQHHQNLPNSPHVPQIMNIGRLLRSRPVLGGGASSSSVAVTQQDLRLLNLLLTSRPPSSGL